MKINKFIDAIKLSEHHLWFNSLIHAYKSGNQDMNKLDTRARACKMRQICTIITQIGSFQRVHETDTVVGRIEIQVIRTKSNITRNVSACSTRGPTSGQLRSGALRKRQHRMKQLRKHVA